MIRLGIFDKENWSEIGAALARNKTRTFMTAFGIFWGTAILAFLWGGSRGFQDVMMRDFEGFATNMGVMFSDRTTMSYNGFRKGEKWDLTIQDIENIRRGVPNLDVISAFGARPAMKAVYGAKSTSVNLQGVEASYPKIMTPVIYQGRFINAADVKNQSKVCVIGKQVATNLFGVMNPIGSHVKVNDISYTVVGVAGQLSDMNFGGGKIEDSIIIPLNVMMTAYNMGNNVGVAMLLAKSGYSPSDIEGSIRRILRNNHPNLHPQDTNALRYMDVSKEFKMVDNMFMGISILALFVGASTLLAGVIGVGNIMWIIVKERTREIGIRRAIGATPRDIIVQILSESIVLTTLAGTCGVVFSSLILAIVTKAFTVPLKSVPRFELQFNTAIVIVCLFVVLGTLAGIIPAMKAMKIKPVEAMNDK